MWFLRLSLPAQTLGGHVATRATVSDLNPILAAGKTTIHLVSKGESGLQVCGVGDG